MAVIGCGGSGKTTLSRELGRRLDLPILHIDGFYESQQVKQRRIGWPQLHNELVSRERWIIDGMKLRVLAERLERADTVIFLDLPRRSCLWGVMRRRLEYRGKHRPELGVWDRVDWPFIRWIWRFPRHQRPAILASLASCSCNVVVLGSRRAVRTFLETLAPDRD